VSIITIRNLDDRLRRRLSARAAEHGCTIEQEAHAILAEALGVASTPEGAAWLQQVRGRFQGSASEDFVLSSRREVKERELPRFEA
jgi:antitoxin FitA